MQIVWTDLPVDSDRIDALEDCIVIDDRQLQIGRENGAENWLDFKGAFIQIMFEHQERFSLSAGSGNRVGRHDGA